ncbi:hypothetical protein CXG81DRAFT_26068 [Caulochytrium protostelioides]|uniref:Copper transport protein n=1 Tax=Caulochytrium protostelioides TaxID=1555241 RepID=A0A4P9X8G1_9FUNG|nr:hypothetical protein CXG81DRAFT_26068 [Caulochytrium protostelioides]|eukprot:RKP01261.1 hypothetical protein CXG81DRAFT_26068 [Caulochytrium protostelioides]
MISPTLGRGRGLARWSVLSLAVVAACLFQRHVAVHAVAASSKLGETTASEIMHGLCDPAVVTSGIVACSLYDACISDKTPGAVRSSLSCSPVALAYQACTVDRALVDAVDDIGAKCQQMRTVVCKDDDDIPECDIEYGLPATLTLQSNLMTACGAMSMDGCDRCEKPQDPSTLATCDVLSAASHVCRSMDGMASCNVLARACVEHPDVPALGAFCHNVMSADTDVPASLFREHATSSAIPSAARPPRINGVMRMYLHTEINDTILFRSWVPQNAREYFGIWLLTFLMALALAAIDKVRRAWRARVRRRLLQQPRRRTPAPAAGADRPPSPATKPAAALLAPSVPPLASPTAPVAPTASADAAAAADDDDDDATVGSAHGPWMLAHDAEGIVAAPGGARGAARRLPLSTATRHRLIQAAARAVEVVLAYLLMLIVMTFNVGLMGAAAAGVFVGAVLWEEGPGEAFLAWAGGGDSDDDDGGGGAVRPLFADESEAKYCH